jgi:hypothetical protein
MISESKIAFNELHVANLAFSKVKECGSVFIPAVFVTVLAARATSHQENEIMLGRRHHAALLLAAEARMNIATPVI